MKISKLFSAVLCTTIVHSYKHTYMSRSCRCTRACWFRFSLDLVWVFFVFLTWGPVYFLYVLFIGVGCIFSGLFFVVSTSASDCLKRLVSKMTCYVSSGT